AKALLNREFEAPKSDDVPYIRKILVEKGLAETTAGVGEERLDRTVHPPHRVVESLDAIEGREICFQRLDNAADRAEIARSMHDFRLVGGNDQIKAVLRTAFRQ